MTNIVEFPRLKRSSPPQSMDEVQENLDNIRHVHVEESLAIILDMIFDNLSLVGFNFDPDDPSYTKDVALMFESLKSMLYKYHRMDYPLQVMADSIFTLQGDGNVIYAKARDNEDEQIHDGD